MHTNYALLFEHITLAPWGGRYRRNDPFHLADADTFNALRDNLDNLRSFEAKFSLYAAVRKVACSPGIPEEISDQLEAICIRIYDASTYNDMCQILEEVRTIFNQIGYGIG